MSKRLWKRFLGGRGIESHRPRSHVWLPVLETLEFRRLLATVSWVSATSGSWDVASNWSTDAVPGPTDDVVIDVSGRAQL